MTEQELDLFMRNVLLDAIALDEETNTETIPYTPSLHHQKQIKAMLKNPLRWARDRERPVWKRALKRVAVILLVISLAFGSLMVVSPTARATFIRWVTEWYETHVTYRYSGPPISEKMPQYEITALPDGYEEDSSQRIASVNYVGIEYRNKLAPDAPPIYLDYIYMQQGTVYDQVTDDATISDITVNGMTGYLYLSKDMSKSDNSLTDTDSKFSASTDYYGFLDADESAWYGSQQQGVIKSVVQLGIMNGYTDGTFHPIGNITLSEAIKMAAVVHATCNNQTISFSASDGGKWYDAYLNYCVKNRIVSSDEYSSLDAYATRAQIAHIFAKATSDFAVVNDIDYDYIPDVSERSEYADEILALYRAGILTGDERTRAFRPSDTITRAEAAAIISRVALPTTRIKIV